MAVKVGHARISETGQIYDNNLNHFKHSREVNSIDFSFFLCYNIIEL